MLTHLFKSLKIENVKTEKVFRINTKQTDKPKPLIVVLKDKEDRSKLLNLAKNLKKETDYKTVYICPDLTEARRMNFKRLLAERNQLNKDNKENEIFYGIRGDRVEAIRIKDKKKQTTI